MPTVKTVGVAGAALLALSILAHGQEAQQRQHELSREELAPERLREQPEPLLIEDDEFGEQLILQRLPPPPFLAAFADLSPGYSSNPLLDPDGGDGDTFFAGTIGLRLEPHIIREWEPALSMGFFAHYQIFRYDDLSVLDFDSQTAGFQADYVLPHDFRVYGGWSGSRLVDRADRDQFFRESQVTLGVSRPFPQTARFALIAGYQGDWRATSPGHLSRLDHGPYAGARTRLGEHVWLDLRYRLAHQHYLEHGRDDLSSHTRLSIGWRVFDSLTLRAQGAYAINNSNRQERDYDVATARLATTLSYSY